MTREEQNKRYTEALQKAEKHGGIDAVDALNRLLAKTDLFYLLTRICGRKDIDRDWLYDRCVEVQNAPDGHLDLWSREHYKSTIITFGKSIQDILNDPTVTIGIFSYKVGIAIDFLKQIKRELEENKYLKHLFPEILYDNPQHQSKLWNEAGLLVKRRTNPKEATVEANGLVESMPTSKHYRVRVYDDVVTEKSVTSPEQIKKTTEAWELSLNLASEGGVERYIGTRYHFNDTYATMLERKAAVPRIYPATDNGKPDGTPVLWNQEYYNKRRDLSSPYIFSCQMLQNPKADDAIGFKEHWINVWVPKNLARLNKYILVDPANTKNKRSDFTAIMVVGMGEDDNFYILDMVRDRLDLVEKATTIISLVRQYKPIRMVGYEQYGMQADIEAIKGMMEREQYRFNIKPLGGKLKKEDRIQRLIPLFEQGRIYIPDKCIRVNREGLQQDLTQVFIREEYLAFPFAAHDDMLDCLSRIVDSEMNMKAPDGRYKTNKVKVKGIDYSPWR